LYSDSQNGERRGIKLARILVIDDQPIILRCLRSALKFDGHEVVTVDAADTALSLVDFPSFDIVITDYAMPRMDGMKFIELAHRLSPGVPVIMITGYGSSGTEDEAKSKGAFGYLPKPFTLDALRNTVEAANTYSKGRRARAELTAPGPA
jgi:DNA-binding NtrC family response regulator